ncbi:MAG: putative dehydrogenase [Nevskia sp.]|nr:putative dehydrogenase [Nevskia sp.]
MYDYSKAFRVDGKVALVSGGARGLGAEIAIALAQVGASVMVTDVLEKEGKEVVAQIKAAGNKAAFLKQDVTSEAQWQETVAATIKQFGGLDILVNNAGIERMQFLTECDTEEFRRILDVNVTGVYLGCKHAITAMRPGGAAGKGGSIVNLSSIAGLIGVTALGAYNASKGAVRIFSKSVAMECAALQYGIRCNSIHPGVVWTDMGKHFVQNFVDLKMMPDFATAEATFKAAHPLGYGAPSDIANAAVYLSSPASRWVTGAELVVDGGYTAA